MSKAIVWIAPDNTVRVTIPVEPPMEGEAEDAYLDRIEAKCVGDNPGSNRIRVDLADLPTRRLRSAWRHVGGVIQVNLPAARQQIMAEVRAKRDILLASSDSDKAKLDDIGNNSQKQAMKDYRQSLRDFPTTVQAQVDALGTAADLANYVPNFPGKPS